MTIPDPHALPEDEAAVARYVTEADQAWDGGEPDRACDLYRSVLQSGPPTPAAQQVVGGAAGRRRCGGLPVR